MAYIIPALLIILLIYSAIKKVNIYSAFVDGVNKTIPFITSIFPYLIAVFLMCEVFELSGLSLVIINLLKPICKFLGLPVELTKLILLKPFSGSGSLALLAEIFKTYGVNSYLSLSAAAVYGSSETIFYVTAVYLSKCQNKKVTKAILISLFATFFSTVLSCNILKLFY